MAESNRRSPSTRRTPATSSGPVERARGRRGAGAKLSDEAILHHAAKRVIARCEHGHDVVETHRAMSGSVPHRGDFGPVIARRNQGKRRDGGAPDARAPPTDSSHHRLGAFREDRKNKDSRVGTCRPVRRDVRPKHVASPPGPKARREAESALRARPVMNTNGRVRTSGVRPRRSVTGSRRGCGATWPARAGSSRDHWRTCS